MTNERPLINCNILYTGLPLVICIVWRHFLLGTSTTSLKCLFIPDFCPCQSLLVFPSSFLELSQLMQIQNNQKSSKQLKKKNFLPFTEYLYK